MSRPNPNPKSVSKGVDGEPVASQVASELAGDAELVAEALAGDTSAFDRLVERHHPRAVSVAYRLVGNAHDAWEVAQEAFIRAYRSLGSLKDRRRFGSWLLRIVTNLSLNLRRSRRSQPNVSLDQDGGSLSGGPALAKCLVEASAEAPDERLIAAETREAVTAAISSLPEKQRVALTLFAIEGLPQAEVAQIMTCSIELVKWNVFEARKRLHKLLKDRI